MQVLYLNHVVRYRYRYQVSLSHISACLTRSFYVSVNQLVLVDQTELL